MNNRLCLHLMANKEKGFALPLAVLIGLILMVTGMTMMMRAQGDQSKVIAQNARADAFRSSEVGLARVQDLLNSVRVMARVDSNCSPGDDCWQTAEVPTTVNPSTDLQRHLKKLAIATACGNTSRKNEIANKISAPTVQQREVSPGLRDLASGEWFRFQLNDNRYYRVVGYDYRIGTGRGVLTLEGLSRTSAATDLTNTAIHRDSDDNAASRNRVVVTIPILPSLPLAFNRTTVPALWVSEGATENAGATGQIMVGSADYSDGANFQGDVVMSDTTKATGFDEDTGTLQPELECFISTDKIKQPKPAPNPPYKAQFVPVPFPNLPPIPDKEKHPLGQQNLEIKESAIFPREGDAKSSSGVYEYIVNNIDLDDDEKITITPGNRVVFYVKGNINGAIEHNCGTTTGCKPGNLQIYADAPASAKPQICLRGNQRLEAFIFAPTYSLGKTGTGAFVGAAWGKNWGKITGCAPPGDTVAVTQGVEWTDLPGLKPTPLETLPQLGKIANWCEEPIDTAAGESKCD
ncbi:MAG: hypothetical protein GPJ14_11740 [Microcystis aeruginosa G11-01]|nr:hypothetical protein [Microcystis aeruginosa G13-10]NCS34923.1 hypothetical protein [Microcystis aeruginosa G11-01]